MFIGESRRHDVSLVSGENFHVILTTGQAQLCGKLRDTSCCFFCLLQKPFSYQEADFCFKNVFFLILQILPELFRAY